MTLDIEFLNARQGDAIWIRWGDGHQIMIDMGVHQTGVKLAKRLRNLPRNQRTFDLLVVTHVDVDHIGGVLSCVVEPAQPVDGLTFNDVWFNGFEHLSGKRPAAEGKSLEPMGGAQGEVFSKWLRQQRWNEAFDRQPVVRSDLSPIDIGDGLSLTVLGPSQQRLTALIPNWEDDVRIAIDRGDLDEVAPGLESLGPSTPPVLETTIDLEILAEADTAMKDTSTANGSSITLLLEWQNRRVLLTGDAFADEVVAGLNALAIAKPITLDLIKAPHHGSRQNMNKALVESVDCPLWVFSTDGTTFRHPDAQAIARILHYGNRSKPTLAFNAPSTFNGWWANDQWQNMYDYAVDYGTTTGGLTISLQPG